MSLADDINKKANKAYMEKVQREADETAKKQKEEDERREHNFKDAPRYFKDEWLPLIEEAASKGNFTVTLQTGIDCSGWLKGLNKALEDNGFKFNREYIPEYRDGDGYCGGDYYRYTVKWQ